MPHSKSNTFSDDEIERAMATVARVIELNGDTYWPILERLESELEDRRARSARLGKHLQRFQRRHHAMRKGELPKRLSERSPVSVP